MEQMKCPGQDTRFWKPGDIFVAECPKCGAEIEFFKDDTRRRCAWCGHMFYNPKIELGCAEWCQYAEKCVPDLVKAKKAAQTFRELLAEQVQNYLKDDAAAWEATERRCTMPRTSSRPKAATPRWSWPPRCCTGWTRIRPGTFWPNWRRNRNWWRPSWNSSSGGGEAKDLNRQLYQDALNLQAKNPDATFHTRTARRLAAEGKKYRP